LALLFLSDLETSLSLIGRDATLTGRTELWSLVLAKIWERPWLGYGYSGFWQGPTSEAGQYVWSAIGWDAPHAHNGLLDLWIDLGLLGLIIYVLIFSLNFIQAINWVRATKTAENYFPLVYLVFIFLANLTESNLLVQNDIIWILYVMISSSLFVPIHKPSKSIVY
jgi:O-antigen ligase